MGEMIAKTESFHVATRGRDSYEITGEVARIVSASGLKEGIVTVFVRHTSASLVIYENADPSARKDLHEFLDRIAPDGEAWHVHTMEGPDDTASHLRRLLCRWSVTRKPQRAQSSQREESSKPLFRPFSVSSAFSAVSFSMAD